MAKRTCAVEGCNSPAKSKGWCGKHHMRWVRNGDPEFQPVAEQTLAERLAAKLVPSENGCLEWKGGTNHWGYGTLMANYKRWATHRLAWELANGPIPEGLFVCHHCDNPPCCNVDHLFLGTHTDNVRDMVAKGRHANQGPTCKRGHEYTPENTSISKQGRVCLTCQRADAAAWRARTKFVTRCYAVVGTARGGPMYCGCGAKSEDVNGRPICGRHHLGQPGIAWYGDRYRYPEGTAGQWTFQNGPAHSVADPLGAPVVIEGEDE